MDRGTPPRLAARRWPSALVTAFIGVVLVNLALIYVAFEMDSSSAAGGDAAGNAMSAGFVGLFEYAALVLVGIPTLLFMVIRRRGFRVAMLILLGLSACLLLMLASLIHANA